MPDALPETKPERGASAGAHMRDECAPINPGRPWSAAHGVTSW